MSFSPQEEDPFDRILSELNKLVQMTKKCSQTPLAEEASPELINQVIRLERDVMEFNQISEEIKKRNSNPNKPKQMAMLEESAAPSKQDSRIAKKLAAYKKELQAVKSTVEGEILKQRAAQNIAPADKKAREGDKPRPEDDSKLVNENRKNKFRPIGGKKRWLPL